MKKIETQRETQGRKVEIFIIGAMKAGTTSLHKFFSGIDSISVGRIKEYNYFTSSVFDKTSEASYHENFDRKCAVWCEIAPNYSKRDEFPGVARRIFDYNPQAKIIYITRDPIARALSEVRHYLEQGEISSETQIHWFKNHRSNQWKKRNRDSFQPIPFGEFNVNPIIQTSRYRYQLEPYRKLFYDSQIRVLSFEDLTGENFGQTIVSLCEFMGFECRSIAEQGLPREHQGTERLLPNNTLMYLSETSSKLDWRNWIFIFPKIQEILMKLGWIGKSQTAYFESSLISRLKSFFDKSENQ